MRVACCLLTILRCSAALLFCLPACLPACLPLSTTDPALLCYVHVEVTYASSLLSAGPDPPVVSFNQPEVVSQFQLSVTVLCSIQSDAFEYNATAVIQWYDINVSPDHPW